MSSLREELERFSKERWSLVNRRLDDIEKRLFGEGRPNAAMPVVGDWWASGEVYFRITDIRDGKFLVGLTATDSYFDDEMDSCTFVMHPGNPRPGDYFVGTDALFAWSPDEGHPGSDVTWVPKEAVRQLLKVAEQ